MKDVVSLVVAQVSGYYHHNQLLVLARTHSWLRIADLGRGRG